MTSYTVKSSTIINTTTANNQSYPSVTVLQDGGWVVTWASTDSTYNTGISEQRFDANGVAVSGEVQITSGGSANTPSVTQLPDGGWLTTWTDYSSTYGAYQIYYARYDENGNLLVSDYVAHSNSSPGSSQTAPSVTVLLDGGWVVTWQQANGDIDGSGIVQQRFDSTGTASGPVVLVNDYQTGNQQQPIVTFLVNGGWVVTWQSVGEDGDGLGVYQQQYDANGATVNVEMRVNTYTTSHQANASVAALADGGWVVTWQSQGQGGNNYAIYQQRYDENGSAVGGETPIDLTSSDDRLPKVVGLANGGWVVAWIDATDSVIYTQAYDQNGDADGGPTAISDRSLSGYDYSITALHDGGYVVTWGTFNGTDADIAQTIVTADASTNITVTEDVGHAFLLGDFDFAISTGTTLTAITITEVPQDGTLVLGGLVIQNGDTILARDIPMLLWTPSENANGDGLATLKFTAADSNSTNHNAEIVFNVTAVNDAPTAADDTITLNEDASHTFAASDFGFADVDGDSLATVIITALPANGTLTLNGNAVTANQPITAADLGNLVWTPAANANGSSLASITFRVTDGNGGTSAAHTLTFDVTAVNDAPTAADDTITVLANTSHTFAASDFGFADVDGDSLATVIITALPANGTLTLNGNAVTANQPITAADLGNLVWAPATDASGTDLAEITFKVTDGNGGTSAAHTLSFDVNATNHAPVAVDDTAALREGLHATVNVLANDTDADSDVLSVASAHVTSGHGTVFVNIAGNLVVAYDGPDLDPGQTATIKVEYVTTDGSLSDTGLLTVTVNGVREPGDDIIGTPQADVLKGTSVGETITALGSDDVVSGLGGDDIISGGDGNDTLSGGIGNDTIQGGAGNDTILGGDGNDKIGGSDGDDKINGGKGNDVVSGGDGNDTLAGADGNDTINGGNGDDKITGGAGNDTINGGNGDDAMAGGAGADTFVFDKLQGNDTITDFQATGAGHDVIDLSALDLTFKVLDALMSQVGSSVIIDLPGDHSIKLLHVDLDHLTSADFLL